MNYTSISESSHAGHAFPPGESEQAMHLSFVSQPGLTASWPSIVPSMDEAFTASHPVGVPAWLEEAFYEARTPAEAVAELHQRSGLTWAEVARLFAVCRRTVHNWQAGLAMASSRQYRIEEILEAFTDFQVEPRTLGAALRGSAGGRPLIDIIGRGLSAHLIPVYLAEKLGPPSRRRAPRDPISTRLLPPRKPQPHRIDPRTLVRQGALPPMPEGEEGDLA